MKHLLWSTVFLVTALSACESSSTGLTTADRAAIEASSKTWVETYNRNDWERLATLFTTDAIMMPPNGPEVRGRDAIAAWETENENGFRIAIQIEEIDGGGDTAYVRGRSCVFIPNDNGGYGVDGGKFIEVRKKQSNGEWLIQADIFNSDAAIGTDLLDACPFVASG